MKTTKATERAWREVSIPTLRSNFAFLRSCASTSRVCPVLKANAYGHGAAHLAPLYEAWGADMMAVATAEEALALRHSGVTRPICLLGSTPPDAVRELAAAGIVASLHSPAEARLLSRAAVRACVTLPVQIKIDTGMGRIGFVARGGRESLCVREVLKAAHLPKLQPVGLFTHFSSSDECGVGQAYTQEQLRCFIAIKTRLSESGLSLVAHASNSAATLGLPEAHFDMVRPGIALYGVDPRENAPVTPLATALTLKARVTQIKRVCRGDAIGYGRTFTAPRAMRVATLSIGYADGLLRCHAACAGGVEVLPPDGKGPVFLPFVGRISMDQCAVDATLAPFLRPGYAVTVLGGRGRVSFAEAASRIGTIPYELFTSISPRANIVYIEE